MLVSRILTLEEQARKGQADKHKKNGNVCFSFSCAYFMFLCSNWDFPALVLVIVLILIIQKSESVFKGMCSKTLTL